MERCVIDPEGKELAALLEVADLAGCRVLEIGCGDGRLTRRFAQLAVSVLALDPDAEWIARAPSLRRVRFRVGDVTQLDEAPGSFDLAVFSWSL